MIMPNHQCHFSETALRKCLNMRLSRLKFGSNVVQPSAEQTQGQEPFLCLCVFFLCCDLDEMTKGFLGKLHSCCTSAARPSWRGYRGEMGKWRHLLYGSWDALDWWTAVQLKNDGGSCRSWQFLHAGQKSALPRVFR